MSGLEVENCFLENLYIRLDELNFTNSEKEKDVCHKFSEKPKPTRAYFDLEKQQLIGNQPHMCGDRRPPARFTASVQLKSPEELLQGINDKMHKNATRREQYIQGVVLKSRRFIEKVNNARERLVQRELETSQNVETTLQVKNLAAEKLRQRILQCKLARIRKQLEHAKIVKDRKLINIQLFDRPSEEVLRSPPPQRCQEMINT